MKPITKNIILCSMVIYFVLSIVLTVYDFIIHKHDINLIKSVNNPEEYQTKMEQHNVLTANRLMGRTDIIIQNFLLLSISLMLGVMIAVFDKIKETSNKNYLWEYLIGYVGYHSAILIRMHSKLDGSHIFDLLRSLIENMKYTFWIYTLFFSLILIANILISKRQVKNLNQQLKKISGT